MEAFTSLKETSQSNRAKLEHMLQKDKRSEHLISQIATIIIQEFKIFKDLSQNGCNITGLIDHIKIFRSFEQKELVREGEFINKDEVYMAFDGECGIYKNVWNDNKNQYFKKFLVDAKCGTLVGMESHMYEDCPAMFTVCTSEKTKMLSIDITGFNKFIRPFM